MPRRTRRREVKKGNPLVGLLIFLAAIMGAVAIVLFVGNFGGVDVDVEEGGKIRFIRPGERLAMHIHAGLRIIINGEEVKIPAGVGIVGDRERILHTHEPNGVIHIESPVIRDYTLGDFFKVWGMRLTDTCILEYCNNETHRLIMLVNGVPQENIKDYVLRDGDAITLIYDEVGNLS